MPSPRSPKARDRGHPQLDKIPWRPGPPARQRVGRGQARLATTHNEKTGEIMKMHRGLTALGTLIGICATVATALYLCALHKQHEGIAFVKALSEVRVGATSRDEFTKKMMRFKEFESSSIPSACYGEKCYKGVGYGLDNITLGRYSLFPKTNLAAGIFFDSNNIAQGSIVTLDRIEIASATLEEQPELTTEQSSRATPWSGRTQQIHLVLDQAHRQDMTRLAVSCFTSWFGCDTAHKLLPVGD